MGATLDFLLTWGHEICPLVEQEKTKMPKTKKGKKILNKMKKTYGPKEGKKVFYASANKGTITGVEKGKKK